MTDADATRPIIKLLNRLIPVNVKFKNYFSVFLTEFLKNKFWFVKIRTGVKQVQEF